jgi:hypothetical protein
MKKGIDLVKDINKIWYDEIIKDDSLCGILMTEPFSDGYWSEKYKIVLCNLETYDQEINENILNLDCFRKWLNSKSLTIKRSAVFLYCLSSKLKGVNIDKDFILKCKNNNQLLLDGIKNTTYMNLLKDANPNSKFDVKYFYDFFKEENNINYTKDLINALEPDIFIVTSEGINLIEKLYNIKFNNHIYKYNNILFVSLGHPSRCFSDEYIINSVNMISENI